MFFLSLVRRYPPGWSRFWLTSSWLAILIGLPSVGWQLQPWLPPNWGSEWQRWLLILSSGVLLTLLLQRWQKLQAREQQLRAIVETHPGPLLISRLHNSTILYANPEARALFGVADLVGRRLTDFYPDPTSCPNLLQTLLEQGRLQDYDLQFQDRNHHHCWIQFSLQLLELQGERVLLWDGHDITRWKQQEALSQQRELRLQQQAFHDPLTGLANRSLFLDRLEQALARSKRRPDYSFALLFLDLDDFKQVNDTLGHGIGDQVLVAIAQRLKQSLRAVDTVARLGGDEFTVLLEDIHTLQDATALGQRLQQELSQPLILEGHHLCISASLGMVLGSAQAARPEDLLQQSDAAMYRAKAQGRGRLIVAETVA